MREINYMIFDVFTDQAFSGNPLAVVFNADGLSANQMQAIAREFNLSETIFFHSPANTKHAAKVHIFMPNGELPFAGHPTIGGAIAYAGANALPKNVQLVLEEEVGPVSCVVTASSSGGHASFIVPRLSQLGELDVPIDKVALALGIEAGDLGFGEHRLSLWSAGVPYIMVPVKDVSILQTLRFDAQLWLTLDVRHEGKIAAPFIYAPDSTSTAKSYCARMFSPWDGIPEDPATGSAVAAFSGAVWQAEDLQAGVHDFAIRQGVEMGRPSKIMLRVHCAAGSITSAAISGDAVKVAQGKLFLPD